MRQFRGHAQDCPSQQPDLYYIANDTPRAGDLDSHICYAYKMAQLEDEGACRDAKAQVPWPCAKPHLRDVAMGTAAVVATQHTTYAQQL